MVFVDFGKATIHIVVLSRGNLFRRVLIPELLLDFLEEGEGHLIFEIDSGHADEEEGAVLEDMEVVSMPL